MSSQVSSSSVAADVPATIQRRARSAGSKNAGTGSTTNSTNSKNKVAPAKVSDNAVTATSAPVTATAPKRGGKRKSEEATTAPAPGKAEKKVPKAEKKAPKADKKVATDAAAPKAKKPKATAEGGANESEVPRIKRQKRTETGEDGQNKAASEPRVFIESYGDLDVKREERKYDKEAHEEFRRRTYERILNQTLGEWRAQKRAFFRNYDALNKNRKRKVQRQIDRAASLAEYEKRLAKFTDADFAELNNKWLSIYGFEGSYDAAALNKTKEFDASSSLSLAMALVLYKAAVKRRVHPLGIVSECGKAPKGKPFVYNTEVMGERYFVDKPMRFSEGAKKTGTKFSVTNVDEIVIKPVSA